MKWLDLSAHAATLSFSAETNSLVVLGSGNAPFSKELSSELELWERVGESNGYRHVLTWDVVRRLTGISGAKIIDVRASEVGVDDMITALEFDEGISDGKQEKRQAAVADSQSSRGLRPQSAPSLARAQPRVRQDAGKDGDAAREAGSGGKINNGRHSRSDGTDTQGTGGVEHAISAAGQSGKRGIVDDRAGNIGATHAASVDGGGISKGVKHNENRRSLRAESRFGNLLAPLAFWQSFSTALGDRLEADAGRIQVVASASTVAVLEAISGDLTAKFPIEVTLTESIPLVADASTYAFADATVRESERVLPDSNALLVAQIQEDRRIDQGPWEASRGMFVDEAQVTRYARSLVRGGLAAIVLPVGLIERDNAAWRAAVNELAEVVDVQRTPSAWWGDGEARDVLVLRRRFKAELTDLASPFLKTATLILPSNSKIGHTSIDVNLAVAKGRGSSRIHGKARLELLDPDAKNSVARWVIQPPADGAAVYQKQLVDALEADKQKRLSTEIVELPMDLDPDTVVIKPPAQMSDLFGDGRNPWPTGFYGTALPALEGRLFRSAGLIYEVVSISEGKVLTEALSGLKKRDAVALGMILDIRDAVYHVLRTQLETADDVERNAVARAALADVYDRFHDQFGPLNRLDNRRLFQNEPDAGLIASVEKYDDARDVATKAEIFTEIVVSADDLRPQDRKVETITDAFYDTLNRKGVVDIETISLAIGRSEEDVANELVEQRLAYPIPGESGGWETRAAYLSGDVKTKFADAQAWAERNPIFTKNIEALKAVLPPDVPVNDIAVQLGAPWIPPAVIEEFVSELLGEKNEVEIEYSPVSNNWHVKMADGSFVSRGAPDEDVRLTTTYGTSRRPFHNLLERALNQKSVNVYDPGHDEDGKPTSYLNVDATIEAHDKLVELEGRFSEFIYGSPERAAHIARTYNEHYNRFAESNYDGRYLDFPGMNRALQLKPHQANAVARFIESGRLYLAHEVTTGKTFTMVACMMEARRLGIARKPTWTVPDHLTGQSEREARRLYPLANILTVTSESLSNGKRALVYDKIRRGDWDIVILSSSASTSIKTTPTSREAELARLEREIDDTLKKAGGKSAAARGAVRRLERVKKERELLAEEMRHGEDEWSQLGIDMLVVDEAQNYKNLEYDSTASIYSDPITGSNRARSMFEKVDKLYRRFGEVRNVIMAGGTPITNKLVEIFTIQRFMQPDLLRKLSLESFDKWAGNFLKPVTRWEPDLAGEGFSARVRTTIHNAPELMSMLRQCMDVVTQAQSGLKLPELLTTVVTSEMTADQRALTDRLVERLGNIKSAGAGKRSDNHLRIVSDGRKVALHAKLMDPACEDSTEGRIDAVCERVLAHYKETDDLKGTQILFCDMGVPKKAQWSFYIAVKNALIRAGIPEHEIAIAQNFKSDRKRASLQQNVRDGVYRVVLSSTQMLGEGTNLQDRMIATHHLDPTYRPSDIKQRDHRGRRHGNIFPSHHRYIYTTKDSFDRFMWDQLNHKQTQYVALLQGDRSIRTFSFDVDPSFGETVMITTGNPVLKAKVEVEDELKTLERQYDRHQKSILHIETVTQTLRATCQRLQDEIAALEALPPIETTDTHSRLDWTWDPRQNGIADHDPVTGHGIALTMKIRSILKPYQLSRAKGIEACGIKVDLEFDGDSVGSMWRGEKVFLQSGGREHQFSSLTNLEDSLETRDNRLAKRRAELANYQKKLAAAESERPKEFEHNRSLQVCKRTYKVIMEIIELNRTPNWSNMDSDVARKLNSVLVRDEIEAAIRKQEIAAVEKCEKGKGDENGEGKSVRRRRKTVAL